LSHSVLPRFGFYDMLKSENNILVSQNNKESFICLIKVALLIKKKPGLSVLVHKYILKLNTIIIFISILICMVLNLSKLVWWFLLQRCYLLLHYYLATEIVQFSSTVNGMEKTEFFKILLLFCLFFLPYWKVILWIAHKNFIFYVNRL